MGPEMGHAQAIKQAVDDELCSRDGFESHMFRIGAYNEAVGDGVFSLPYDDATMALLILSTPDMFDVAFRKWVVQKTMEFGSFEQVSQLVTSPIQTFLEDRLDLLSEKLRSVEENFEILHDYSMTPQRRPKVLMQTCGHVAGAAFYYQPRHFEEEGTEWPPKARMGPNLKFIGLSLHPIFGGHFAFRSVLIFPNVLIPDYRENVPRPILTARDDVRMALEKFNYNWKDSGFRDFGNPTRRYSTTQMEFFGRPVAERWQVLRPWIDGGAKDIID